MSLTRGKESNYEIATVQPIFTTTVQEEEPTADIAMYDPQDFHQPESATPTDAGTTRKRKKKQHKNKKSIVEKAQTEEDRLLNEMIQENERVKAVNDAAFLVKKNEGGAMQDYPWWMTDEFMMGVNS